MKKAERIRIFLKRLAATELCESHDAADALIEQTLNAVEDEYSGIPFNPDAWQSDGRLYPPQADNSSLSGQHRGVVKYRTVGHRIFIAPNGAFEVQEVKNGNVLIAHPGRDGQWLAAFAIEQK